MQPFGDWRIRALASATELRFPPGEVNEAAGMLEAALGIDWLNEQLQTTRGSWDTGLRSHPLGTALQAGGDHQILEVLELAAYLRSIATAAGAMQVIPLLKSHYYSARFHLGVAARVTDAGATSLTLEPPASGGLAGDICFVYEGHVVQAECYRPTVISSGNVLTEVRILMQDGLELFRDFGAVSIGIQLRDSLNGRSRKQIVGALKGMHKELVSTSSLAVLRRLDHAIISVGLTTEAPVGEQSRFHMHPEFRPTGRPQFFTRIKYATRKAFELQKPDLDGPSGSHVGVWLPDGYDKNHINEITAADSFARLTKKISKKLPQTRGTAGSKRLMFVETPLVKFLSLVPQPVLVEARREFFGKHSGVGGVVLMERQWNDTVRRHEYRFEAFIGEGQLWVSQLCDALTHLERNRRFPPIC